MMTGRNIRSTALSQSVQVRTPQPTPEARIRLYCLPYAGGDGSFYNGWPRQLTPMAEVCIVDLPGRAPLFSLLPFTSVPAAVDALLPVIEAHVSGPFAFFGYSMGALLSFELAQALRSRGGPQPQALFVAAHRAVDLPSRRPPMHDLPEAEFIERLRELQGTPPAVLEHGELMSLLLPLLRADFSLCETYRYEPRPALDLPIHAFGGINDKEVNVEELRAWEQLTTRAFTLTLLPGNHFFLQDSGGALISRLENQLAQLVRELALHPEQATNE